MGIFRGKKEYKDLETIVVETNKHLADMDSEVKILRQEMKFLRELVKKSEERSFVYEDEIKNLNETVKKIEKRLTNLEGEIL